MQINGDSGKDDKTHRAALAERQNPDFQISEFTEELVSAQSEEDLFQIARQVIEHLFEPTACFIGVSQPGNKAAFRLYSASRLSAIDSSTLQEMIEKLLNSAIQSSANEVFKSFPFLQGAAMVSEESALTGSSQRIRIFVFGGDKLDAPSMERLLRWLVRVLEVKLIGLRATLAMERRSINLSRLHISAESLSRNLLNGDQIMQAIVEEARKILGVEGAAILMSADETKSNFIAHAQSGFSNSGLPISPELFVRALEDFISFPGKLVVHYGADHRTFVLVPLIQAGTPEGALFLYSSDPAFQITDDLNQIAEIFGDWASIAIENAVMFQRVTTSQREWENTFDSIADPIYIIDSEYRLRKMNRSLAGFAMKSIKLPVNRNCYRYLFHRSTICPWCPVPKVMQSEGPEPVRVEAPLFSGGVWQIESFPFTDKAGRRIGSINVLRDITVLKNMQEQLIESEKLASAGKLISGVAHEVRNPLFGISTTVRALANELGNREELKPYLDIVTSETARLNKLMEDLLNYSRPVQIDKSPSDFAEIINEVIRHFQTHPSGQNAMIELHAADGIPAVLIDSNRIKQVLINLFENAIQHTEGPAKIEVFLRHMLLSTPPEIHLVIKDMGKGISAENLQRIFDPFFTTRQRGTGLGLSIVRKVIHVHGGRIAVESHLGVGTTFRISLPANTVQV